MASQAPMSSSSTGRWLTLHCRGGRCGDKVRPFCVATWVVCTASWLIVNIDCLVGKPQRSNSSSQRPLTQALHVPPEDDRCCSVQIGGPSYISLRPNNAASWQPEILSVALRQVCIYTSSEGGRGGLHSSSHPSAQAATNSMARHCGYNRQLTCTAGSGMACPLVLARDSRKA